MHARVVSVVSCRYRYWCAFGFSVLPMGNIERAKNLLESGKGNDHDAAASGMALYLVGIRERSSLNEGDGRRL